MGTRYNDEGEARTDAMLARTLSFATLVALIPATQAAVVVGQLGQALRPSRIHKSPNIRSGIYFKPKAYQYLIVKDKTKSGWNRVMMSNGADGYIREEDVAILPYRVTSKSGGGGGATRADGREVGNLTSRAGAARAGLNYVGTPYKWGGNDLMSGIDCSGFVKKLYGKIGVDLPRTAAEQALVGQAITDRSQLQAGDRLYFWDHKRNKIGHTGLYLGNGYFVHSSSGHKGVAADVLTERWQKILVAARR
ncbi:NlpC/P60 family protein [bacterium]|nr:MAG: NlpC/P60 family protein [bacterium]